MTTAAETSSGRFSPVMIWLHWTIAALMIVTVVYGLLWAYADTAADTQSAMLVHQSVGMVVLVLFFARLVARFTRPVPPLPPTMPKYQVVAAQLTHILLYVSLIAFPVTGYLSLASRGREVSMFGLFDLPRVVPRSLSTSAMATDLHVYAQWTLYGLVALHIVAALYHQFIVKDGVLMRMWPARRLSGSSSQ